MRYTNNRKGPDSLFTCSCILRLQVELIMGLMILSPLLPLLSFLNSLSSQPWTGLATFPLFKWPWGCWGRKSEGVIWKHLWCVKWETHVQLKLYWPVMFLLMLFISNMFLPTKRSQKQTYPALNRHIPTKAKKWYDCEKYVNVIYVVGVWKVFCLSQWSNTHFHHFFSLSMHMLESHFSVLHLM